MLKNINFAISPIAQTTGHSMPVSHLRFGCDAQNALHAGPNLLTTAQEMALDPEDNLMGVEGKNSLRLDI